MHIPKNIALFVVLLLEFFFLYSCFAGKVNSKEVCSVCGRQKSKGKTKTTQRFYEVDSSSPEFLSCFGADVDTNGLPCLCSACYRALNKYKTSGETSSRVSKQI